MNRRRLAISTALLFTYGMFCGGVFWLVQSVAGTTATVWSSAVLTAVALPLAIVLARWVMTPPRAARPPVPGHPGPVLAVPLRGQRTREYVLGRAPTALGGSVVLGWGGGRTIVLELATANTAWIDDLVQALWEARRTAAQEVRQ